MTEHKRPDGITPSQTIGPFFAYGLTPQDYDFHAIFSHDLTEASVPGERIRVEGIVYDGDGAPITDAMVEIWQADPEGRYATPTDKGERSNAGFAGFGRAATDAEGRYSFVTVKPGRVPGANGDLQAPHLSMSLFARGMLNRLHTRIYFADEASNASDAVLNLVPADARDTLIAKPDGKGGYTLDIHVQGEKETVFFAC